MSEHDEVPDLLSDVLGSDAGAADRERLLAHTLGRARVHRRMQRVRRVAGSVMVMMLGALLAMRINRESPMTAKATSVAVHTTKFPAEKIVTTAHIREVAVVTSRPFLFSVHTTPTAPRLTDQQLLAFAGDRPVALIRVAPHEQRLFFLDETGAGRARD